jgi:hypothetical protein
VTTHDLITNPVFCGVFGALVAVVGAFFAFTREVGKDLGFLKGETSVIRESIEAVDKVMDKVIEIDKEQTRIKYDVERAWEAIREVKDRAQEEEWEQ